MITPEKYLNAYESIGIVTYTYMPGANYMTTGKIEYESGGSRTTKAWIFNNKMDVNSGLDTLYMFCKNMGADALMNFKAITVQENYNFITNPVTIEGFELSGYAIKRK